MALYSATPAFRKVDAIPANVPPDRVFDYDIFVHGSQGGDFAASRFELRTAATPETVFWTPFNGGHWVPTRAAEIDVIINDAERFGNNNIRVPKEMNAVPPLRPLQLDPPEHMKYRKLLMGAFSPAAVAKLGEKARQLTVELIDGFIADGHCEFVGQYARIMPIGIFMSIVDLPMSDRPHLIGIVELLLRPRKPQDRADGLVMVKQYIADRVSERTANPGTDLISQLIQAKVDGEPVERTDLEGMLILLLMAGLDTVASMLSCFVRFLALSPGHRQQLIDEPSLIPGAVEELLRRFAIVNLGREVRVDVEIGGVLMKAGDMVVCPTPLSNLDEDKLADSLTVDFRRKPGPNATFGGTAHRCMGSMLARTELRVFLEEWLKRIPHFEIEAGAEIEATADITSIIPSLPLRWTITTA